MPRKAKRKGRKVTTGSSLARPVRFRVTSVQRDELDAEGQQLGVSGDLAAKWRAFPKEAA